MNSMNTHDRKKENTTMTLSLERSMKDDAVAMAREMGINNLSGLVRHLLIEKRKEQMAAMRPLSPSAPADAGAVPITVQKRRCKGGKHCCEKLA